MPRAFWERYAATHPYHAVVTTPAYLGRHLDASTRRDFFRTGTEHADALWTRDRAIVRRRVPAPPGPRLRVRRGPRDAGAGGPVRPRPRRGHRLRHGGGGPGERRGGRLHQRGIRRWRRRRGPRRPVRPGALDGGVAARAAPARLPAVRAPRLARGARRRRRHSRHLADPATWSQKARRRLYARWPMLDALRQRIRPGAGGPIVPMYAYDLGRLSSLLWDLGVRRCQLHLTSHGLPGALIIFQREA